VRLRDASMVRVPVPAGTGFLVPRDGLVSAQSPDVAFVCDHERTWRIDFRTGEFSDPIAGRFRVVDSGGTLVEWFGGVMIARGEREVCPFVDGRAVIFDSGRGVCRDDSGAFVLRSLWGEPDIPLPCPPPLYAGPLPAHGSAPHLSDPALRYDDERP
jgi:hypothetical protein